MLPLVLTYLNLDDLVGGWESGGGMVGLVEIAPSTSRKNIKMWEFAIPYIFHYVVGYDIMLIGSINFN